VGEIRDADKYLICHFLIENRRRNNVLGYIVGGVVYIKCIYKVFL